MKMKIIGHPNEDIQIYNKPCFYIFNDNDIQNMQNRLKFTQERKNPFRFNLKINALQRENKVNLFPIYIQLSVWKDKNNIIYSSSIEGKLRIENINNNYFSQFYYIDNNNLIQIDQNHCDQNNNDVNLLLIARKKKEIKIETETAEQKEEEIEIEIDCSVTWIAYIKSSLPIPESLTSLSSQFLIKIYPSIILR